MTGRIEAALLLAQALGVLDILRLAGEPLRRRGPCDFGASDLVARSLAQGHAPLLDEGYARTPPPDLLSLQRKFVGTFLLSARLPSRCARGY